MIQFSPLPPSFRKVAVFGIPHALTYGAFDYLRAVLPKIECRLVTSTDPQQISRDEGTIYLRSRALDALQLVCGQRPFAPPDIDEAIATARRMDARWSAFPTIPVEDMLDETTALRLFSALPGGPWGVTTLADPSAHRRLRLLIQQYDSPIAYLKSVVIDDQNDLTTKTNRRYSVAGGREGVGALVTGWLPPDDAGVWLGQRRGALRLYSVQAPLLLTCFFDPVDLQFEFSVVVNGVKTHALIDRGVNMTRLSVVLPEPSISTEKIKSFTIEMLVNDANLLTEHGVRLTGFQIGPRPPWRQSQVDGIRAGDFSDVLGSSWTVSDRAAYIRADSGDHFQHAVIKTVPRVSLIIGTGFDPSDECAVVASISTSDPLGHTTYDLKHTIKTADDLPRLTELGIDRIHLDHVRRVRWISDLLPWAQEQLSYRGILTGSEDSADAARDAVAALCRSVPNAEMTISFTESDWVAWPAAYWRV